LTQWAGFEPYGYRTYVHIKNDRQFDQETMAAHCREIAAQFGSAHVGMAVCAEVSKKSFADTVVPYQFPFLQMRLFLLVLFDMEVILSVWMVRRQKKQSVIEQMRA